MPSTHGWTNWCSVLPAPGDFVESFPTGLCNARWTFELMEKALWYLIAGTRGGENRARIIRLLDERPRNANQLADKLDVEYNTVRHHLETLEEYDVVDPGGSEYAEMYFLTDQFDHHRETFEQITENMEEE